MADQKKYTNKLLNACVLVIGGSSGIGYAVAEAALESGAIVTISSSNPQRVATKVQSLQSAYPSSSSKVHGVVADLSNPSTVESEIERMFKQAVEPLESKHFDHVIFTAADALSMMPLKDMSMEKILKAGQLRFFAPLLVAKYLPHYLTNSHKSSYTITTGGISESPVPDWSVIGSYAGGHHAMVRNLALDLRPIRVCGV
ncbi:NAD(P)-binding protein, partial [Polyplosphaeria fusca]